MIQILSAMDDGDTVTFEEAFPAESMQDSGAREREVFTWKGARAAFGELKRAAAAGNYGEEAAALVSCFEHDKQRVTVKRAELLAVLHGTAETAVAPCRDQRGCDSPTPQPSGAKAKKRAKPKPPPLPELRLHLVREGAGACRLEKAESDSAIEVIASQLLPNEWGYSCVTSADVRKRMAEVLLSEWLQCGATKIRPGHYGSEDAEAERMGGMLCNWIRKRSCLTLGGTKDGRPWWLVDVFRAALASAAAEVLGSTFNPSVSDSKETASNFCRRFEDTLGGMNASHLRAAEGNPEGVFQDVRHYVEAGVFLLDKLGLDIGDTPRRMAFLIDDRIFSQEYGEAADSPYLHLRDAVRVLAHKWPLLVDSGGRLDPDRVADVETANMARTSLYDARYSQNLAGAKACLDAAKGR